MQAVGPASGCNEGGDKHLAFNIEKVVYTDAAGSALDGESITCGTDILRNPLQDSEKAIVFNQVRCTFLRRCDHSLVDAHNPCRGPTDKGTFPRRLCWIFSLNRGAACLTPPRTG